MTSNSQRFLFACGIILFLSGIFHGIILLITQSPVDGPVSWRKPAVFGLSFGLTTITLALLAPYLRMSHRFAWWVLGSLGLASVLETGLITLQTWRGVPSHFNFSTPLDITIFVTMGVLVAIIALTIVILTVKSLTAMQESSPAFKFSVRTGMVLLVIGQILGATIIQAGVAPAVTGEHHVIFGPNGVVLGEAGILKHPHGIALHAIQVLPLVSILAEHTNWQERTSMALTAISSAGYCLIVLIATIFTYSGRNLTMLSWAETSLLVTGFLLVIITGVIALSAAVRNSFKHSPVPVS